VVLAPLSRPKLNRERVRHGAFGLFMIWHTLVLVTAPHLKPVAELPHIYGAELGLALLSILANLWAAKNIKMGAAGAVLYAAFIASIIPLYRPLDPTTPYVYAGIALLAIIKAAFIYIEAND
jgi:hypothetical protein